MYSAVPASSVSAFLPNGGHPPLPIENAYYTIHKFTEKIIRRYSKARINLISRATRFTNRDKAQGRPENYKRIAGFDLAGGAR